MDGIKTNRVICVLLLEPPKKATGWDPVAWGEVCGRFSPQVSLRGFEAVFLEMSKSHALFGDGLSRRIQRLAARFGIDPSKVRIGEAADAGMALVCARYPRFARDFKALGASALKGLSLEALIDFGSPFRFDPDLQRKTLDLIRILKELGIRSVAGFIDLPSESLASRFGQEISELAMRLQASADGRLSLPWPGFHPKSQVTEFADLECIEGVSSDLSGLLFVLKTLVDRSVARLRGRGERTSMVQVELDLENWSTIKNTKRRWKLTLPLPMSSAASLLAILQETLSYSLGHEPLEAPARRVSFTVLEAVPGYGAQRDFFSRKEEEAELWDSLVSRLSHKLGKQRVFVAQPVDRYLPEESWVRKLELKRGLLSAFQPVFIRPERPSRLLEEPLPLQRVGALLRNISTGHRWRILDWDGPERLSGEWWKVRPGGPRLRGPQCGPGGAGCGAEAESLDGFHRDYYQVKAESGERLWVFVCRSPEGNPIAGQNGNGAARSMEAEPPTAACAAWRRAPRIMVHLHGYFD